MRGTCRLCLREDHLRRSHIVPEWCYKPAYDDKHRARVKSTLLSKRQRPKWEVRWLQKGWRERLLCDNCEQLIGRWEERFARFWRGWTGCDEWCEPKIAKERGDSCLIKNLEYEWFKLFHLSVLWRGSVSQREEFASISLGPYEEKVRRMLLSSDPSPVESFPLFGTLLLGEDGSLRRTRGLMMSPERQRYFGAQLYFWIYGGCEWLYAVTDDVGRLGEPLAAVMRALAARPGKSELRLWVRPHIRSNTLKIACEKRGSERSAPSLPRWATRGVLSDA